MDKQQFARAFPQYGYGRDGAQLLEIDRLRAAEFAHMRDGVYLDHAGATMYSTAQLERVFAELRGAALGNPHSGHGGSSESTAARVARVKRQALRFFRASADEYELVFTAGATAALKLVGESFPWRGAESTFAHAMDSHTSVLGIRGYAAQHGATISCVPLADMARMESEMAADSTADCERDERDDDAPLSLFAFPAECNFSGARHSLSLVQRVHDGALNRTVAQQRRRWLVLLDAAKFVGTHQLDLSTCKPDFVALSFYKMFGYPTGLGALLVRKSALRVLRKTYYGGGAVQSILATQHLVVPRGLAARGGDSSAADEAAHFADGTQSFLSIMALRHGFDQLETLGMARIAAHTAALTALLHARLAAMKHWNGTRVCEIYGNHGSHSGDRARTAETQGSIVACNLLRPDGSYVGYSEVNKLAAIHSIQLRTGCFCNPGACQAYLRLTDSDLLAGIEAGHVCGDDMDLLDGRPTGAVRLSIGYMTSYEDITAFTDFVAKYFVSSAAVVGASAVRAEKSGSEDAMSVRLRKITLFPIKSCSGMVVDAWPVGTRGLLFDREWAIVDAVTSKALSLKELPELCFVHPRVDLKQQTLTISFRRHDDPDDSSPDTFVLPLSHTDSRSSHYMRNKDALDAARDMRVCTGACKGHDVGLGVSHWLGERLKRQCALVRVTPSHLRDSQASAPKQRSSSRARAGSSPTPSASSGPESSATTFGPGSASSKIGFANQAQYLLMSRASVADLNAALRAAGSLKVDEDAFRANLIVDGCEAFEEDTWTRLRIGSRDADDESDEGVAFDVSGPCSRCSMINVDPKTGAFSRAPLQALARYRRERSHIFFGQFLTRASKSTDATTSLAWLRVGASVAVERETAP